MTNLSALKLAQKLEASNKRGIMIGLGIAALVVVIAVLIIAKVCWMKKHLGCSCDDFDEYYLDDDDLDDDDCAYTSEKDFVE